jgi:hypothetical protein
MATVLVIDPNIERRAALAQAIRLAGHYVVGISEFDAGIALARLSRVHVVATPIVQMWPQVADAPVDVVVYGEDEAKDSILFRILEQAQRHAV